MGRALIVRFMFALVAVISIPAMAAEPLAGPEATALTVSQDGARTRVKLALTERTGFRHFTLTDPYRLIIDFPYANWALPEPVVAAETRLIKAVRIGVAQSGAARLVVDLRGPARIAEASTTAAGDQGATFTMDIVAADPDQFAASAGWPDAFGVFSQLPAADVDDLVTVVIDPGHGGIDPGAAAAGIMEKNLVLDYAQAMADIINGRSGFRAVLTRQGDVFLGLRDRVNIARGAQADVFLSLHADSLATGDASGTSVFTLSQKGSDREAIALSQSANRADVIGGVEFDGQEDDVVRVLVDIARRQTAEQSTTLAKMLVTALSARTKVLRQRAHQSASFMVLKAPDVPSVLIELGFLSSVEDQARLTSSAGQSAIVEAVTEAVFGWAAAQQGPRFAPARQASGN